jgi:small subunit ribosomal protein S8e
MAVWHLRAKRKPTGGKLNTFSKKKLSQRGSEFLGTSIGAKRVKAREISGGGIKRNIYSSDMINVVDKENRQWKKAKILTVVENPANPHFVRRNIITRGAVVKTDIGLVRVTSRPGQDGVLNGILVKK